MPNNKNSEGRDVTLANQQIEARPPVNLPQGGHDEVLLGALQPMLLAWSKVVVGFDNMIVQQHGEGAGRSLVAVVPILAYAHVSKAAWALCSAANIHSGDFDPIVFGARCEAIAREQIERYRNAEKTGAI